MSKKFGATFGAGLALTLLGIYAWSAFAMIYAIITADTAETTTAAGSFSQGYTNVMATVGGLVSALVIVKLSFAKPGTVPTFGTFTPTSNRGRLTVNSVIGFYLVTWVAVGLASLIVGVMMYPDASSTIAAIGNTWLGLAISVGYAYFGIDINKQNSTETPTLEAEKAEPKKTS
jgi:hypothetical protein